MRLTQLIILGTFLLASGFLYGQVPIPTNYQISSPSSQLQNEEQIAVSPLDSNIIVANWRDFRLGYRQVGVGRSTDGGNSWTDSLINASDQVFTHQSDPTMNVDANGNFYMSILDYRKNEFGTIYDSSHISFYRSSDDGASWSGPHTVCDTIGPYFEDKQFVTTDNSGGINDGNLYVAWARFPGPVRIMFARSTDGAATFEDTIVVGPPIEYTVDGNTYLAGAGQFAQPMVSADGTLFVFWVGYDIEEVGDDTYFYSAISVVKSTDGGQSFTTPDAVRRTSGNWTQIEGDIAVYTSPSSAADLSGGAYNGNIYIAYTNDDGENYIEDFNVNFIRSLDGGVNWSEPILINDDDNVGSNPPYDQFHPWLYCNQNGILVTIFYDQRTDPANHYKFDVFAAYSFDGGETFTSNHRISEVSIDPGLLEPLKFTQTDPGEQYLEGTDQMALSPNAGKIAEYIGVTAFDKHVNAIWTDTRNTNQDVFGANYIIPRLTPRFFLKNKGPAYYTLSTSDTILWTGYELFEAVTYLLEIDSDIDFSSVEHSQASGDHHLAAVDIPLTDGLYYARVKTIWSDASESDWSETVAINLYRSIPSIPYALSPDADTVKNVPLNLFWSAEHDPLFQYYNLQLSDDLAFDGTGYFTSFDSLTANIMTITSLPEIDNTYYWRVNHRDLYGNQSGFCPTASFVKIAYICGDANGDQTVNVGDAVFIINYVFKGGAAPVPYLSGDANNDASVNVGDAVYEINYVFKGGPPPDCSP